MARSDPDKLAQALRANLRRRKAGPADNTPQDGSGNGLPGAPEAPESFPETPRPQKG